MVRAAMIPVFIYFGLLWLDYLRKQRFKRRKKRLFSESSTDAPA